MDVTFSPDGQKAYVTNRLDDTMSVIDTKTRKVIATVPVGDEPHGACRCYCPIARRPRRLNNGRCTDIFSQTLIS